ncbi:MAG: trypsin-like peptidase domain-containing protein [Thermoleophilaceae bacterium]
MTPMTSAPEKQRIAPAHLVAGALGGLVVLVLGAILIATDVIGGETTRVVQQQAPLAQPVADAPKGAGRTVGDIYRREAAGVVFIQAQGGGQGESPFGLPQQEGTATGSGFVVDRQGFIVTNAHDVEGASKVEVSFNENDDPVEAEVKGRDPSSDLAVLKVNPDDAKLTPIPLGNSSEVKVGDAVIAIGNPFGLARTVTTGIVSAKQREIEAPNGFPIRDIIQTDASINPGNSGGPLLDANGRVIGINSQIATGGSSGSVGIGFAVPVNTAKKLLPQLKTDGQIERAYLGVEMAEVTERVADDLNLPAKEGALIQQVVPGGPAAEAGLRGGRTPTAEGLRAGGDLIVEVDGKKVTSSEGVAEAIAGKKPGDEVEVTYFRGEDRKTTKVKLEKRPESTTSQQGGGSPGGPHGPGAPHGPGRLALPYPNP